jgi:hypothetical protein
MRRLFAGALLGALLLGSALLLAVPVPTGCPAGCCNGPEDCPQPTCCRRQ